jgi:lipid-A-disaccharide synthase
MSYMIARHFVRIKRIGLPNIILEEDLLPELVQDDVNARRIVSAARRILDDPEYYTQLRARLLNAPQYAGSKRCSVGDGQADPQDASIDV